MPSQTDWDSALAALARGATLVTGNARLARRALADEACRRREAGEGVWRRADVLPWAAWLRRLHDDALTAGLIAAPEPAVLLSAAQTEALWRRVIDEDDTRGPLLQTAAAARQAMEAYELCRAWGIDSGALAGGAWHDDVAVFVRWAGEFERRLRAGGFALAAGLPERVPAWLRQDAALRPAALYLAGFEEWIPQQRVLLEALEAAGIPVYEVDPALPAAGAVRLGCADADDEMRSAACWARERLLADSGVRIGILASDLRDRRAALLRHLEAALAPATGIATMRPRPWNVSLGQPLADEPMVHDALLALSAATGRLDFVAASRLLRSPFVAADGASETVRLRAELRLRARREPHWGTGDFARLLVAEGGDGCTTLAGGFAALAAAAQPAARRPPADWAEQFAGLLAGLGWPGRRGLSSHEYQTLSAWEEILGEFAALGAVLPALSCRAALSELRRLAAARLFQPSSGPAPVQVLGLLEALGQRFDHVWILGLHDGVWPEAPRPNPFLPFALQREHGLPRATAARELEFARGMTERLLRSAPEVVVSWPRRGEDHALRPSPLIADLPEREPPARVEDHRRRMLAAARFEHLEEERAPALEPGGRLAGGTALLAHQSSCPFRAFAVHRLRATAIDSPVTGLDPLQRGQLVHRLLERFWTRVPNQESLRALGETGRRERVREVVREVTGAAARERPEAFTARFLEIENQRLEALLLEWLECELARPPFAVVARELDLTLELDGLHLRGRVDRVDELADGSRLIIDYKTGETGPGRWLGERPAELQLPLYALHFGAGGHAGLAVAALRAHRCGWHGVVREEGMLPGAQVAGQWQAAEEADWETLHAGWKEAARRLAAELETGRADADPQPGACRHCHLPPLCRIHELAAGPHDAAADEGEDLE